MVGRYSEHKDTFKYLNARKVKNAWKVYRGFHRSRNEGVAQMTGNPFAVSIEPTTACNLGCPECPSGLKKFTRNVGNLKTDFFRKTVESLKDDLIYLTFYFQGEPYINPDFLDMVRYAHEQGIYTATSTNAHFLNEENAIKTIDSGLDRLIVSLDGTTQEVYEQYRVNGDINKVLEGVREVVKWKKKKQSDSPRITLQFLVVKPNEHQIGDAKRLARELGVDGIRFKTAQVYDYINGNPLIPTIDKYARYRKNENDTYEVKNDMINQCWRMWHSCVITWDGLVVPCCFDKDATHQLGDLKSQSFQSVWHSDQYNNFRNAILKSRSEIDICTNCTEGTKVWA